MGRRETNRANAQRSTGPKDTASTRYNAVKHGLLAEGVTELDSPENFAALSERLRAEYQPEGEVEAFMVRRVALGMVRLRRAGLLEAEFITSQINQPITRIKKSISQIVREIDDPETVVVDPGLPTRISAGNVDSLANRFQRYETSIENKLFRAMHELERLQMRRRGEHVPAPVAADVGVSAGGQPLASFGNSGPENGEPGGTVSG